MNNDERLRIGQVAAHAGVKLQTLRFYERRGLVPPPPRQPSSGYRTYPRDTVRLVRFIKQAQGLGFTLREVEELLRLRARSSTPCLDVEVTAKAKLDDIDHKIRQLLSIRAALAPLAEACSKNRAPTCPLLESLEGASGEADGRASEGTHGL